MIYRPIVIDEEIKFSQKKMIISHTDIKGRITFVNKNFCDISGYNEDELIGSPHNILRHPDMPRAIFFLIWNTILKGKSVSGIIKSLAKSGKYYWVIADFDVKKDSKGNIEHLSSVRKIAPDYEVDTIEELYDTMLKIERKKGIEGSLSYLESYLEEQNMVYDEFLNYIVQPKGMFDRLMAIF